MPNSSTGSAAHPLRTRTMQNPAPLEAERAPRPPLGHLFPLRTGANWLFEGKATYNGIRRTSGSSQQRIRMGFAGCWRTARSTRQAARSVKSVCGLESLAWVPHVARIGGGRDPSRKCPAMGGSLTGGQAMVGRRMILALPRRGREDRASTPTRTVGVVTRETEDGGEYVGTRQGQSQCSPVRPPSSRR